MGTASRKFEWHGLSAWLERRGNAPLHARIVKVADAYDAMTSDRPYRRGKSHADTIAILRSVSGLRDEDLLALRICDLGVSIEGSELEPRVRQFHDELAARGVALRPDCYLGDEWFSPAGAPAIAIPFYLAHPRLKALELRQMLEVEGGTAEWCQMLLRHECGHTIDYAIPVLVAQGLAEHLRES